MLTVGDRIPAFDVPAVVSNEQDKAFMRVTDTTDSGKWKVVFFWPKDFTFVCPTEIAAFGKLERELPIATRSSGVPPRTANSSTWPGAVRTRI